MSLPELQTIIKLLHSGQDISVHDYKHAFVETMKRLGYSNPLNEMGDPESLEFDEVFHKICKMLDLNDLICECVYDMPLQMEQQNVVAYVNCEGHFSTWLRFENGFSRVPEYVYIEGEGYICVTEAAYRDENDLIDEYQMMGGFIIRSTQSITYTTENIGKIPNVNTCGFEACIHILMVV
jgi:hypothetical protein